MNTSESFLALHRANPRRRAGFAHAVEAATETVLPQIGGEVAVAGTTQPRRKLVRVSAAGASLAVVAVVAAFLTVGSLGNGPGVASATAAVAKAATVTAASAERSGTAAVRMTHNGQPWAEKTVRWNAADVAIAEDFRQRELRVVDGVLYGSDPERSGGWVSLGKPTSIVPGSGTTPDEHLAAVREDLGGETLRRITAGMTGLTTRRAGDGSTIYSGRVAAGLIARETGFKEGQSIRVLPFGYVAHDEAEHPAAGLDTSVTVGAEGIVREIAVRWGTSGSAWTYTVTYSELGSTPAPAVPANVRPLTRRLPAEPSANPGTG